MSRLIVRYTANELARMRELFFPEERRSEFTSEPWDGVSFRHYRDPKVVCIEHYLSSAHSGFTSYPAENRQLRNAQALRAPRRR